MADELSLEDWAKVKPEVFEVDQKDIQELHDLFDQVAARLLELGVPYYFSFVTKCNGIGASQLQSRIGAQKDRITPEIWCGQFLANGGLDTLLGSLDVLLDCANEKYELTRKLILL